MKQEHRTAVKLDSSKFSSLEEETYYELEKFVHYLAGRHANGNVMMSYDEIVGELLVELVKGVRHYSNLEMNKLKAVIRRMMDNRISELKYRFFSTHRNAENYVISLNLEVATRNADALDYIDDANSGVTPVEELIEDVGSDPANLYESKERVTLTRERLSPVARDVFDSVVYGNNMLSTIMLLAAVRSTYIYKSRVVTIKPWHIADALHMDEQEVKIALKEIKEVYSEVCYG